MRAVFDPNVLISAALSPAGAPAELVRRWLGGEFELVVSPALLDELERVLVYPNITERIPPVNAGALLRLLAEEGHVHEDPESPPAVEVEDPGDEYLIALAVDQGAALVSGDGHLTDLADPLPIYRPAEFLKKLVDPET